MSRAAAHRRRGDAKPRTAALGPRPRQLRLVEDAARPLVKWAGGKARLLGELLPRLPVSFGRLIEPFAGGCALFFRLAPDAAVLGDINADLMELYEEVRRDPAGLHARASELFERHATDPDATFYAGRAAWNERRRKWPRERRAATFLYLNRACFNGLYRVNRAGEFNVPVGRSSSSRDAHCPTLPQIVAIGEALRRATIRCADYVDTIVSAERGDLVYLDPPYLAQPRKKSGSSSFQTYTQEGFGERDHAELARHARALVDRGVHVMASNADVPLARELYGGFHMSSVSSSRPISARAEGRARVGELIFASYPVEARRGWQAASPAPTTPVPASTDGAARGCA